MYLGFLNKYYKMKNDDDEKMHNLIVNGTYATDEDVGSIVGLTVFIVAIGLILFVIYKYIN